MARAGGCLGTDRAAEGRFDRGALDAEVLVGDAAAGIVEKSTLETPGIGAVLAGAEHTQHGHVARGRVVARVRHNLVGDAVALDVAFAHADVPALGPAARVVPKVPDGSAKRGKVPGGVAARPRLG